MNHFSIRQAHSCDYAELAEVMFEAVRDGAPHYTEEQRNAWVPQPRSGPDWNDRLASQAIFLAESEDSILGFMSLADDYVDFAYIRPAARGVGIFRLLYNEIEAVANQNKVKKLRTHSSLTARPAFTAVGFCTETRETVQINSVSLDRFEMSKLLVSPDR